MRMMWTCRLPVAIRQSALGTKWIGSDGWVWVDRGGFDASNREWVKPESLPENLRKVKLYESAEHQAELP